MGKLRDRMPIIDTFIDQLRDAFGREAIDRCIVDGIRDGTFCAQENGCEVGQRVISTKAYGGILLKNCSPWNDKAT